MSGEHKFIDTLGDGQNTKLPGGAKIAGKEVEAATAGTTNDIRVLIRDIDNNILWSTGTEVPSDDTAGYAKGALHIDTNVDAGTTGLYVNIGDTDDCNFAAHDA